MNDIEKGGNSEMKIELTEKSYVERRRGGERRVKRKRELGSKESAS